MDTGFSAIAVAMIIIAFAGLLTAFAAYELYDRSSIECKLALFLGLAIGALFGTSLAFVY